MTYPATTYAEGVELTITSGNQLHEIINGDATEEINTESGMVPSVRKALADSMLFKPAIAWAEGSVESDPFQTRLYGEGIYWAPSASNETPISMGTNPNIDGNWFLAPVTGGETISRNTNLLSNHNFITQSPDDIEHPSVTPTDYVSGTQVFSGVFVGDDIVGLTYIDGRVSWTSGTLYFSVPNSGALEYVDETEFVASVADFDGKPRTRGVSYALVGDEYRVTVGVDSLEDESANETLLGSVKFEQGSVATGHEATEALTAMTISGVTNYQAASVADMVLGRTLKGQDFITPPMVDSGDISISTQGYYGAWSVMMEPKGGANYILTTIQRVRDVKSDPSWEPDGYLNHYLFGGTTYVAMINEDEVSPLMAGAKGDGVSYDSDSVQAVVDNLKSVGQDTTQSVVNLGNPPVGYRMNKPIWVYEKDGANFNGAGSSSVRFLVDDLLDTTMPSDFSAINGNNGHTYDTTQALFIVAARRRTQSPTQGYIPANQAAYSLKFKGFRLECTGNARRQVDLFYMPETAGNKFEDVVAWQARNWQLSAVAYSSVYENCVADSCYRPMDIANGTSLVMNRFAAPRCEFGYKVNTYYSTMNGCTIDHWGTDINGDLVQDSYAYELTGIGWTINSGGAEFGRGGLFKFDDSLPRTSITFNGGAFWGGASVTDPDYQGQLTLSDFGVSTLGIVYMKNATVTFNGTGVRNSAEDGIVAVVSFPINLDVSTNVTLNGLTGFGGTTASNRSRWMTIEDFVLLDSTASLTPISQRDKPSCYAKVSANQNIPIDSTTTIAFDNIEYDEYGNTQTNGITKVPVTGYYRINVDVSILGNGVQYIVLTGDENELGRWSPAENNAYISKNIRVKLTKGTLLRTQVRVDASSTGAQVRQDSSFTLEMS